MVVEISIGFVLPKSRIPVASFHDKLLIVMLSRMT